MGKNSCKLSLRAAPAPRLSRGAQETELWAQASRERRKARGSGTPARQPISAVRASHCSGTPRSASSPAPTELILGADVVSEVRG